MKRIALASVTAAVLAAAGAVFAGPTAWGGSTPCSVVDHGTHTSYGNLQTAITFAASGDSLAVKGTCYGNFLVLSKDLTIAGQGGATLDAYGHGTVLRILYSNVTLRGVTVTGGSTASYGGGITTDSSSTLTLHNTHVTNNSAGVSGGGIYNEGAVKLVHSSVTYNSAGTSGGGVYNAHGASLGMKGPDGITNNQPGNVYDAP